MTDIMEQVALITQVPDEDDPAGAPAAGSIYQERLRQAGFEDVPWSAYFYYVGKAPPGGGIRPVSVYQYASHHGPIEPTELRQLVTQLALNARAAPDNQNPRPSTTRFPWRRKSYIIMLVDDPTFSFEQDNAVTITERLTGQNYTFFDGSDFDDIALPDPAGGPAMEYVSAVCLINHMKRSAAGDDLGENEEQRFTAVFSPPLPSLFLLATAVPGGPVPDEDHGTNMGPPIGPP